MLRKYSVVKNWAVGLGAFFALCSVMLAGLINPAGAAGVVVTNVRVGTSDTQTRIVFDMTSAVNAKVFTLADPYRLVIDLPEVGWRLPSRPLPSNIGNVEKLRYGLFQVGNSRVVIDMKAPALVVSAFILKPLDTQNYRFVLDLQTTSRDEFLAKGSGKLIHVAANSVNETAEQELQRAIEAEIANSAKPWLEKPLVPVKPAVKKQPTTAEQVIPTPKPQKPIPTPKPSSIAKLVEKIEQQPQEQASVQQTVVIVGETTGITASLGLSVPPPKPFARPQKREKITVVIDPGHGGIDPGTISLNGVYEKNITLAMARAMKKKLENTGRYKVLITRNRDIFIALRGRVKFAHDAKAALFISLHADSVKNPNTRGASIYTLSERASDKEAAALADKENKADMIAGIDLTGESQEVTNILIDLAQRETMNQSGSFAKFLVKRLRKKTRLLRNTHRFAGFAVLKAPDVPSVLLEMGFLSNGKDERALRSRSHREKMAVAITAAIDDYFKHIGKAVQ